MLSVTNLQSTPTTRIVSYNWVFLKSTLGLWSYISSEKGTHVLVNKKWQFVSLEHSSITLSGAVIIGGSFTVNLISATPTLGTYSAVMELQYTTTSSFICSGSPIAYTSGVLKSSAVCLAN